MKTIYAILVLFFLFPATYQIKPQNGARTVDKAPVAVLTVEAATRQITASTSVLQAYIRSEAAQYGVNPNLASCLVTHESQWNPTKDGKDTGNTLSRGLWQFNSYYHPEVSNTCAHNPTCATPIALKLIASGHVGQWSTYNEYCSSTPVMVK